MDKLITRITKTLRVFATLVLFCLPATVLAHHSTANYDRSSILEMEAELVSVSWRNPHTRFTVKTENSAGTTEIWELDGTAFYLLERAGVTRDLFTEGQRVTIAGYPSRVTPRFLQVTNMLLENGEEVLIWGTAPRWVEDYLGGPGNWTANLEPISEPNAGNRNIFHVWSPENPAVFIRLNEGMELPLTESVITMFEELTPPDPCIPPGMPSSMATPLPIQFVNIDDATIELRLSAFDIVRTITLDATSAHEDSTTMLQGYSTGTWEGNTLVVRTNQISWPYFDDGGIPQTENVDVIERFTLNDNGTGLDYLMTVTEPASFTKPVTLEWRWVTLGEQLSPLHCVDTK
jgi:hypothetical protein